MKIYKDGLEIFFEDLNEKAQKQFLDATGIKRPEDGNWDLFSIAVVPR